MAKAVEDSGVLLEFHFALMPGPTYVGLQIGIQISEYSKSSVLNKIGMKKKKNLGSGRNLDLENSGPNPVCFEPRIQIQDNYFKPLRS